MQSCCSLIVSASAAAPCIDLLQLLLSSPFAFASAAARRLRPLHLLLSIASVSTSSRLRPLRLLLPDCICFNCCSPIASASSAAPRWHLHWLLLAASCSERFQPMPNILEHAQSLRFSKLKYEGHVSLKSSPAPIPLHTDRQTDKHMVKILMY